MTKPIIVLKIFCELLYIINFLALVDVDIKVFGCMQLFSITMLLSYK